MIKKKNYKFFIVAAAGILLGVGLALILYSFSILEQKEIPLNILVSDHVGLNVNTNELSMGTVMSGGAAFRKFNVSNKYGENIKVSMIPIGKIAKWTILEPNKLFLKPGESKEVKVTIQSSSTAQKGNYTGTLKITFTKDL